MSVTIDVRGGRTRSGPRPSYTRREGAEASCPRAIFTVFCGRFRYLVTEATPIRRSLATLALPEKQPCFLTTTTTTFPNLAGRVYFQVDLIGFWAAMAGAIRTNKTPSRRLPARSKHYEHYPLNTRWSWLSFHSTKCVVDDGACRPTTPFRTGLFPAPNLPSGRSWGRRTSCAFQVRILQIPVSLAPSSWTHSPWPPPLHHVFVFLLSQLDQHARIVGPEHALIGPRCPVRHQHNHVDVPAKMTLASRRMVQRDCSHSLPLIRLHPAGSRRRRCCLDDCPARVQQCQKLRDSRHHPLLPPPFP